ncbi:MAG: hypothetical protein M9891_04380 [Austwickia sp.]|nr:hypothetical protein [Actinomycetota bacterium]MCB1251738.1 hypothetical protein [Austwickia sp.]MCO5308521.1 hypothetical protein [Austwickia sp.]
MFEVLLYTDCAADESVSGRSGFQFHAESEGATPSDERVVQQRLLYVVPFAAPVDDLSRHPEMCAYLRTDDGFYLSRGRSTGATLSGRPGNQLTQAVVTKDPGDILPARPAQLYSAPNWRLQKVTSGELGGWPTPLEVAPEFEVEGLHELAISDLRLAPLLPVLLTMGEQAAATPRVKLILVHRDLDTIMRWIALITLFEDAGRALNLSFRAYADDPLSDQADIVAAHPDLLPDFGPRSATAANVVDLDGLEHTDVEPSASARLHAAWFLGGDPYEALDAIEASRRWATVLDPDVAARGAGLAARPSSSGERTWPMVQDACEVLTTLAREGMADELEAYGDELVDVIAEHSPAPGEDITRVVSTVWALHGVRQDKHAADVATACLEWARADDTAARAWAASSLPPHSLAVGKTLPWPAETDQEQPRLLLRDLLELAPDEDLGTWFGIAQTLGLGLAETEIAAPIDRLARRWAAQPDLTEAARLWFHLDAITLALARHLLEALERGHRPTLDDVAAGRWRWLRGASRDYRDAQGLSAWLALEHASRWQEPSYRRILADVSPALPAWAATEFVPRRKDARSYAKDAVRWLSDHPGPIPEGFAEDLAAMLLACCDAGEPDAFTDLMEAIEAADGQIQTPSLRAVSNDDRAIREAYVAAEAETQARRSPGLARLAGCHPRMLRLSREQLIPLIFSAADHDGARALLAALPSMTHRAVAEYAQERLRARDGTAFEACLALEDGTPETAGLTQVLDWLLGNKLNEQLVSDLRKALSPEGRKRLEARPQPQRSRLGSALWERMSGKLERGGRG